MKQKKTVLTLFLVLVFWTLGVGFANAENVTWNPNDKSSSITLSNGNLTVVTNGYGVVRATQGKTSGKWYWEVKAAVVSNYISGSSDIGINSQTTDSTNGFEFIGATGGHGIGWCPDGYYYNYTYLGDDSYRTGDIIGVALDLDNNQVSFYKNGVFNKQFSLTIYPVDRPIYAAVGGSLFYSENTLIGNFGASTFAYSVPAGYLPYDAVPQQAPSNLAATGGNAQVTLSWDAVDEATGYNVKRATTSGGPYATVASAVTSVNYTDTTVTNGTTYYYIVTAVDTYSESANSNEATATPQGDLVEVPGNLVATGGDARVNLSWDAVEVATEYNVKRATTSGGLYETVASGITTTSFTDSSVTNGTTYYYVVTAVNVERESANSNEASVTPQGSVQPPVTGNGTLIVTMDNGPNKQYSLTMSEIQAFISWYSNHSSAYYVLDSTVSAPYNSDKDYLIYNKIVCWEVKTY